jgi:hypothetical protein
MVREREGGRVREGERGKGGGEREEGEREGERRGVRGERERRGRGGGGGRGRGRVIGVITSNTRVVHLMQHSVLYFQSMDTHSRVHS